MQFFKYIFRGLAFYKKKHLAVLLATILSTAILTGALIVGDSVKYSLQQMVSQRLGNIGFAMRAGDRMLSQELVESLSDKLQTNVVGIIETSGVAINSDKNLRINQSSIYGVDSSFWSLSDQVVEALEGNEVYVSENLAQRLSIDTGDFVLVRMHVPQTIAINTPFSQDENTTIALRLKVKDVLTDSSFGRFSLKSDQKSPFNIFASYAFLSQQLGMNDKVNQVFVDDKSTVSVSRLDEAITQVWQLSDMGFKLAQVDSSQLRLSFGQIFINEKLAQVIQAFSSHVSPVFTYLINEIEANDRTTPYSFVSGLKNSESLKQNEIIVNQWLANDLSLSIGDSLSIKYFSFGSFRELQEQQASFVVSQVEANEGSWFSKSLMPEFPGLADAGSCSEWEAGINIDLNKIRTKDEDYWDEFKGTPKAIISYEQAKVLWANNYGSHTGFFIEGNERTQRNFETYFKRSIEPSLLGLNFYAVGEQGKYAAGNGVDFGELFLSLSFFVIVAALLLLILIYKLNLTSRKSELATLRAVGLTHKLIIRMVLAESFITICLGSVLGGLLGIVYNNILIDALNTIWRNAVYTSALNIHITAQSIIIGIVAGLIIVFGTLYYIVKKQSKQSVSSVYSADNGRTKAKRNRAKQWAFILNVFFLVLVAYALLTSSLNPTFALLLGGFLLVVFILWFGVYLNAIFNKGYSTLSTSVLALKNMATAKTKSIMVVIMLALGIFSVLITGANRKTFSGSELSKSSGTGGFNYWAETTLPILYDINTTNGKENLGISDEPIIDSSLFIPMHKLNGDDASCLNLNQVQQPSILGVNVEELDNQKSFSFAKLLPDVNSERPWLFLQKSLSENVYPVYLDQTVIQWGLMKKVGDTLKVLSERGDSISLVIAGGLNASVFQGHMLMDQAVFKELFPAQGGANVFLVHLESKDESAFEESLKFYFSDYGISLQKTSDRLAQFNSVTNTYLNVFMLLGGLALLIGTFGLGLVIIRSLMDRKKEFAILQTVGLKRKSIISIVLQEFLLLLGVGLFIGMLSAFVGMIPSLLTEAFEVPWSYLAIMLPVIVLNSLVWIILPTLWVFRNSILDAIKSE